MKGGDGKVIPLKYVGLHLTAPLESEQRFFPWKVFHIRFPPFFHPTLLLIGKTSPDFRTNPGLDLQP